MSNTIWTVENATGRLYDLPVGSNYSDAKKSAQGMANKRNETIYLVEKTDGKFYSSGVFEPQV